MSDAPAARALLEEARERTDGLLESCAARLQAEHPGSLGGALAYALRGRGKRIRPALVFAAYRSVGGRAPEIAGVAAAVEIVHTYSLVHDDLPCMDDDRQRRGRATTHVAFDPITATRAGWMLVPAAMEELCRAAGALGLDAQALGVMATVLLDAGGPAGMVGGQWLDLESEGRSNDLAGLTAIHRAKTGALIEASCALGAIAGGGSARQRSAIAAYGREVGFAFQIADDLLDATGSSSQLGKTAGRDAALAKTTSISLRGVAGSRTAARRHLREAVAALRGADLETETLVQLAGYIVTRVS